MIKREGVSRGLLEDNSKPVRPGPDLILGPTEYESRLSVGMSGTGDMKMKFSTFYMYTF
jgi:hypothetical protein